MFEPRTRRERVLLHALEAVAKHANRDLAELIVKVAIAQAEAEIPETKTQINTAYNYRWREP